MIKEPTANLDKLNNSQAREVISAAFGFIDAAQKETLETQVLALAFLFREICGVHDLDVKKVLETVDNMTVQLARENPQLYHAAQAYIINELARDKIRVNV
jgi:hypothetical protein